MILLLRMFLLNITNKQMLRWLPMFMNWYLTQILYMMLILISSMYLLDMCNSCYLSFAASVDYCYLRYSCDIQMILRISCKYQRDTQYRKQMELKNSCQQSNFNMWTRLKSYIIQHCRVCSWKLPSQNMCPLNKNCSRLLM